MSSICEESGGGGESRKQRKYNFTEAEHGCIWKWNLCFTRSGLRLDVLLGAHWAWYMQCWDDQQVLHPALGWALLPVAEARDKLEAHSIVKLVKGAKTNTAPLPIQIHLMRGILAGRDDSSDNKINHFVSATCFSLCLICFYYCYLYKISRYFCKQSLNENPRHIQVNEELSLKI